MKKAEAIGTWFNPILVKPTSFEDYKLGEYIVLHIKFNGSYETKFCIGYYQTDYFNNKLLRYFIPNQPCTTKHVSYRILAWTFLPDLDYKNIKKILQ